MDFAFTEEQDLFRKTVRQFAQRELLPRYAETESDDYSIPDLLRRLAEVDLLGLRAPTDVGGMDTTYVTVGIAVEEASRGDYNVGTILLSNVLSNEMLDRHAHPEVRQEWLPEVVAGRRHIGLALTEPHCGSDAAALTTRAVRDGDEWVVDGEKSSTSQIDADGAVVFVRTTPIPGARGVSALLIPFNVPGLGRSRFNDLGMKLSRRGALHLDGVRVPARNLLGEEGRAFYVVMNEFDYSRALIALQCVATAMQSVDDTIEYVKTRTAFGQPIARFEGVSFRIAEAATMLEAARLLCFKTLWLRDQGLPHTKEAAMVKWLGPKLAADAVHQMLLLHGHAGYSSDYPHGQRLRDVIGHQIGDGTGEIMKVIVAREIIGREFRST